MFITFVSNAVLILKIIISFICLFFLYISLKNFTGFHFLSIDEDRIILKDIFGYYKTIIDKKDIKKITITKYSKNYGRGSRWMRSEYFIDFALENIECRVSARWWDLNTYTKFRKYLETENIEVKKINKKVGGFYISGV